MIDCNDFQGEDFEKLVYKVIIKVRKEGNAVMGDKKGYTHNDLVNAIKFTLRELNK